MTGGAGEHVRPLARFLPAGLDPGLAWVLLTVPTVLLASRKFGSTAFANQLGVQLPGAAGPVSAHLYWFGCSLLLYLVVPLAIARTVPALRGDRLGLTLGDWRTGLVATAVLAFIFSWNEFLLSLVLTTGVVRTVPVASSTFTTAFATEWGYLAALGIASMVPIFVFILIVQRHLVRGLTLGAIK